jgi:hypothetical protein
MRGLHSSSRVAVGLRIAGAIASLGAATGCASGGLAGATRAAERGDLAALRTEITSRGARGSLSNDDAAALARAVATHDVRVAPKEEARARVREIRSCASDLDDLLSERMKTHDAAGAEAALTRVEDGRLDAGDARRFASDADDRWRAVGARALTRDEDVAARQKALVDPAPEVRRSAARAAAEAKAAGDFDLLAESTRLDPDPMVRTLAGRALAQTGGARVVARLRDLWVNADDPLREDIARAWATPGLFDAGGREELRVLLSQGHGSPAIDGAAALLGAGARAGHAPDRELDASARALLSRTIEAGSERDRLHAIAIAPLDGVILASIRAASRDADVQVAASALARLTESAPDRAASITALEALAGQKDRSAVASRARLALATAGDLRVQAWLEADLAAPEPSARLSAADALAALGRSARAAPLLVDPDASVRVRAACTLITGARRRH